MATPYTLDLTATQVNAAVNAAHDSGDPVTAGSSKLVQSGAVYDEVVRQIRALTGWANYEDATYTSSSKLTSANARTQLTIDKQGSGTNTDYLPEGVTSLWDSTENKITPASVGDAYDLRIDFKIEPQQSTDYAEFELDIGSGSPIIIASRTLTFAKTGASSFSVGIPIYCLSTFIANGCKMYIDTSGSGDTVHIYDISLTIKRDFSAVT